MSVFSDLHLCADLSVINTEISNAKKSVFRLELLPEYRVDYESETIDKYLETGEVDPHYMDDWCILVKTTVNKGVDFKRVRYLTETISNYIRYEMACCYQFSVAAGEDIQAINESVISNLKKEKLPIVDFWLFDNTVCYIMIYDLIGSFLGMIKILDKQQIKVFTNIATLTLESAVLITETVHWLEEVK